MKYFGVILGVLAALTTCLPASAITVTASGTWGTPGNTGKGLALGSDANETCFLSGVSGSLSGSAAYFPKNKGIEAIAQVMDEGGTWVLRTHAGIGAGVKAHATCINATANRATFEFSDNLTGGSVPATPNRHCFLAKVWATSGISGPQWPNKSIIPNLTIEKTNGQFDFGDSAVNNINGDLDYGGATARCVDIPPGDNWSFTLIGPGSTSHPATQTIALHVSPGGALVPIKDVACFMTAISGNWISDAPDPLGWDDGVFLTADAAKFKSWRLTASSGRRGSVACVR